ncbi:hypothetical protein D3C84_703560 [compost metagenome]
MQRQTGQHRSGCPGSAVDGSFKEVFVVDVDRFEFVLFQHQRIAALTIGDAQTPTVRIFQMAVLGFGFGQIPALLCFVMGVQPPSVLVVFIAFVARRFDGEGRAVLVGLAPGVVHDKTVGEAAELVPLQVECVLDQWVVGHLRFVLVSDAFQRQ